MHLSSTFARFRSAVTDRGGFFTAGFRRILPATIVALLASACLADMRPESLKTRSSAVDTDQARSILMAGALAQTVGGNSRQSWLAMSGVRVRLTDEWYGLADLLVNKWPANPQRIDFQFVPGKDAGVMNFLDAAGAPTGTIWGIHEWNTWKRATPDAPADYSADPVIKFNLPTVQYFLEMAMRLPDGEIVDYAETIEADGLELHVVYITWGSYGPNSTIDQYVAYYRKDNGRLHHVEFTVRDNYPFVTAAAYYKDFRVVQGYYFPFQIDLTEVGDPTSIVHTYTVQEVQLNHQLSRQSYAPDPNRGPASK
ncbi:MAG: hypothetical protein RIF32_04680 [Leptospirales bacterium]|jgi:hypothetical protein